MVVYNAVYGILIGIGLACPILVVATGNIITGLLASFSLCCSTVCVIGVIPLGGWQLGVGYLFNFNINYTMSLVKRYAEPLSSDTHGVT